MNDSLFHLTGKVALVTGGSRGLGKEMVLAFAAHGADVIIASRKRSACDDVATEVQRRFGRRALPIECNVSYWDQCDALVEAAYGWSGKVDILVNNAGLSPLYPSLDAVTESLFDKVLAKAFGPTVRVNCIQAGPFLTDISKAWDLEAFKKRAATSIALGRGGDPDEVIGAALYFASKASSFCTGAVLALDGGSG